MARSKKEEQEEYEQLSFTFGNFNHKVPSASQELSSIEVKEAEHLLPVIPDTMDKSRSQIVDDVMYSKETPEELELVEDSEKEPESLKTKISICFDDFEEVGLSFSKEFNAFDKEVMDAVATLSQQSNVMTSASIYRAMTGKQNRQFISVKQRAQVEASMKKCRTCLVTLDITSMANSKVRTERYKKVKQSSYLISFRNIETENIKGDTCVYYEILEVPILFQFAAHLGKISTLPSILLDTPVSKTENNFLIQNFLMRTIDAMNRGESQVYFIPWEEIYQLLGDSESSKKQYKSNARKTSLRILEDWKSKGFIHDFTSFLQRGNNGISIHPVLVRK